MVHVKVSSATTITILHKKTNSKCDLTFVIVLNCVFYVYHSSRIGLHQNVIRTIPICVGVDQLG